MLADRMNAHRSVLGFVDSGNNAYLGVGLASKVLLAVG